MLNQKSSASRKVVEQLSNKECIDLFKQKNVSVSNTNENSNLLKILFENNFKEIKKDEDYFELDVVMASQLRWEVITYLNVLESILIAYWHNVADKTIIKEQFLYLVNPRENHFVLEEFRKAAGIDDYPGIRDFVDGIKKEKESPNIGKKKTGVLN